MPPLIRLRPDIKAKQAPNRKAECVIALIGEEIANTGAAYRYKLVDRQQTIGPPEWLVHKIPFTDGKLVFSAMKATSDVVAFVNFAQGDAVFTLERTT